MNCPHCGQESPAGARYCGVCGGKLSLPQKPAAYRPEVEGVDELSPRDLGKLIDATIAIYRSDPKSFWAIAILPQIAALISVVTPAGVSWIFALVGFVASILAFAATVHATTQRMLGINVNVGYSISLAISRFLPLILAIVLLALALVVSAILVLLLVGIPLFFFLLVRWFFCTQAIMIEGKDPIAAFSRSSNLVRGSWWRVFGIGIVYVCLVVVLAIVINIPSVVVGLANDALGNIVASVASILIFPIAPIATTLVYLDLRVRKEEYTLGDLAMDLEHTAGSAPSNP